MTTALNIDRDDVQHYKPTVPAVAVDRVLRIQGYPDPAKVRKRVRAATELAVQRTEQALDPAIAWRVCRVTELGDSTLVLDDRIRFDCPVFARFFPGATHAVAALFTIGSRFDNEVADALASDNLLEGVLMESAGWLAVEAVTREFTQHLRDTAVARGLGLTRRMSPGYEYQLGDRRVMWELEDQALLFQTFGDAALPVSLLESSAMLPKMSRSGLIGLRERPAKSL